ncbi:glycerophosphodiester phosphodiesterase family protein [Evansella tamaricis]|uniref:Glycerophosphoryl diester phosphodiesterase membrane domain-containing protein n=1 Tax=Evansella tamaricis TaxID=2069301 RepID=A0ABS6JGL4_9BACI|nr:glycerophosphodiester phosphodiesterase family protein [Evansella tamaricis]MBU9712810.1 glycerophosphoryl diester phosphodiesterase membrane domain-containing protein [Evansella tamaricis]
MFEIIRNSLKDFRFSYKKYLSFALIYMLLTSFLFVPIISFLFNRMLLIIGSGSLLNADVYRIGLSPEGLVGMLVISLLAVVILFIEFGVMIVIAQKQFFNKNILVSEALITTLRSLPKLLGFGIFQLIILSFLMVPFMDLTGLPALFDINFTIFITDQYYGASYLLLFIYILVFLAAIFVLLRLIFTLHFIFIEGNTIWQGMKSSWRMAKSNKLKIIFNIILLNIILFLTGFLFVTVLSYIPVFTEAFFLGDVIKSYLLTFSSYMMIIFSLLLIPVNTIIITRLFFRFKKNQGDILEDNVKIYGSKNITAFENRVTRFFTKRKYTLVAVVLIYITSMFLINFTVNDNIVYLKWNVQVAAHRGDLHSAPENSLSSIRAAIDKRVDVVEIDVMLTKDGVVVLNHDSDLQRVAGVPRDIIDMTYEETQEVDIGRLFSDEFIGERIPTLDEALVEMKEENVKVLVDIKVEDTSRNREFAEKIVDLIEYHDMVEVSYVQAFNNQILQEVRELNDDIKLGQILYIAAGNLSGLDVDFYTIRQTMLSDRFIENAKRQNREVWVWTVNRERHIREVLKYDIDGIITDYPERVQSMLGIEFATDTNE